MNNLVEVSFTAVQPFVNLALSANFGNPFVSTNQAKMMKMS